MLSPRIEYITFWQKLLTLMVLCIVFFLTDPVNLRMYNEITSECTYNSWSYIDPKFSNFKLETLVSFIVHYNHMKVVTCYYDTHIFFWLKKQHTHHTHTHNPKTWPIWSEATCTRSQKVEMGTGDPIPTFYDRRATNA